VEITDRVADGVTDLRGVTGKAMEGAPSNVDALELARVRLELAVDAAGIGSYDWDLQSGELTWDERMSALIGVAFDTKPTVDDFVARILPTDRPEVERVTTEAIRTCTDLRADFRFIDEAGATRWLTTRGRVLADSAGRGIHILGTVFDSSSIHTDREQVARALDTMATAYAIVTSDWIVSYANQAARALLAGFAPREPVGIEVWDLIPALQDPTIAGLLNDVMDERKAATVELRAERLGGWLELSAQPVATGIAVLVSDVTARRTAQNEAEQAAARLSLLAVAGSTLVQRRPVLETVEAGLALLVPQLADAAMIYLRENPGDPLQLVGLRHEDPVAQADLGSLFRALPLGDDPSTATGRAVATGTTQVIGNLDETVIHRATPDPELRTRLLASVTTGVLAIPLRSRGESIGFIGLVGRGGQAPSGPDLVLIEDIASRIAAAIDNAQIFGQIQQARQTAESVTARLEFLASVADALGSTLDAQQATVRLARMLVPNLCDWCLVSLLEDDGRVENIAASHIDPAQQVLVDAYAAARHHSIVADPAIIREIVGVGQPLFQLTGEDFLKRMANDHAEPQLRALAPGFVTAFPILARDRSLGVISLYNSKERGQPTEEELDSAREVARRAGLVLDNARLYARSQSMAVTLQRSLLTPAVRPPDLQIITRYLPAIADSQVGGDWYDAFQTADGTTTLVIGDVMGHDTDAAALMGQLRTLVRAIAVDRQEAPSVVLGRVDAAAEALGVDTTATAVLAQVLPGDTPGSRRLRWSNAGHPPPVLIEPNGQVRILDAPADLLLGFGGQFPRANHTVQLPAGSTVLMFTDGLVEGRSQPFDIGMRRLAMAAAPLTGLSLDQLCDQLLTALMPPQGAEDDVALVAVRILPPTP
jgi:serine phosphatase RsbU (regulator of sigma subunit)/PAS domain-containing protein